MSQPVDSDNTATDASMSLLSYHQMDDDHSPRVIPNSIFAREEDFQLRSSTVTVFFGIALVLRVF